VIQPHHYDAGGILNRTRVRDLPDWFSGTSSRFKGWTDPSHNNGTTPVLSSVENISADLNPASYPNRGRQVTVDENHGFSARQLNAGRGDIGGDFSSTRNWVQLDDSREVHIDAKGFDPGGTWRRYQYDGPIVARRPDALAVPGTSLGNLTTAGATAIARCKPTNNVSNLSTDIFEIFRDGLPNLLGHVFWKDRTHRARSAGGEYLNYEFGWLPLVHDIKQAAYGLANAHRLMSQYESHAGHEVRRRYEFPVVDTRASEVVSPSIDADWFAGANQAMLLDSLKSKPVLWKLTRTYKRTWFSGAFTYHLPVGYRSRNWLTDKAREAGYLLGIELTPDTIWNASPWTWAADWFSNLGDVVSNLSDWATDGLVMRYGYIMEHSFTSVTYFMDRPTRLKPYGSVYATSVTACSESKRRMRASPFGFGVSWNSLTPRQLAIAVALGITRVF